MCVGDVERNDDGNRGHSCEKLEAKFLRLPQWVNEKWRQNEKLSVSCWETSLETCIFEGLLKLTSEIPRLEHAKGVISIVVVDIQEILPPRLLTALLLDGDPGVPQWTVS